MQIERPNVTLIAGVDEVGRGPLVGDVVTAAVILKPAPTIGLIPALCAAPEKRTRPQKFS